VAPLWLSTAGTSNYATTCRPTILNSLLAKLGTAGQPPRRILEDGRFNFAYNLLDHHVAESRMPMGSGCLWGGCGFVLEFRGRKAVQQALGVIGWPLMHYL